jgi:hypothetical protein
MFKEIALLLVCLGYIFFGLLRHVRRSRVVTKGGPKR